MEVDIAVQMEMRNREDETRNKDRRKQKMIKETRRQRVTTQWAQEMESFGQVIDEKAGEEHIKKARADLESEEEIEDGSKGSDDDDVDDDDNDDEEVRDG